jgi:hypothetical protein
MTELNIDTKGNGFEVLEARDGFRKDGSITFGRCSVCDELVARVRYEKTWMHTVYSEKGWYSVESFLNGTPPNFAQSKRVDYCPTVEDKIEIPEIWVQGGNQ